MITTIEEYQPHPSWGSWDNFLNTCDLVEVFNGVKFYRKVNCNYIIFNDGTLIKNYGYNGNIVMANVKAFGRKFVKENPEFNQITSPLNF